MITLCSIFRDSSSYLDRYVDQVRKLRDRMDVKLVLAEGDSTDWTWAELKARMPTPTMALSREGLALRFEDDRNVLLKVDHKGQKYGSVDHPQRWHDIAIVVRRVLQEALANDPDVVVWVESDLIWDTEDMMRLIDAAKNGRSVAPMVFASDGPRFYDTWGFRQNGQGFYAHQPYFPHEPVMEETYAKIDSCGSCFATPDIEALREWDGFWPFTAGGNLWLDTLARVRHP